MKNSVKEMRRMKTSQEVLDYIESIQKLKEEEIKKDLIGLDNNYKSYDRVEAIGYKIAIKKALTTDDFENCIVFIEENYHGTLDTDELVEQIRIKAYGVLGYLDQHIKSAAYQEFVNFTKEENIKNPLAKLEQALNGTIQGETYGK